MEPMESEFPSLQDHCLYHLVTHLNDYSPERALALLPRHLRHILLMNVAPVHLAWLERTVVAGGIDTDSIWERFVQHSDRGLHKGWLNQAELTLIPHLVPRDLYVSFIYQKLFTTNHALLSQLDVNFYPIALFLYGLSEPVIEEGILKVAQNSPTSLIGQIDSLACCVPNYTPQLNTFEAVCSTMLTYNIFPRVLELSISSCDNLVTVGSSDQRPSQLEQIFACSAVTEHLSVTLNDRLTDDVITTTRILSGLGRCRQSQLSRLQLAKVSETTLVSIAPVLTSPTSFLKIKTLELVLFHGSEKFVQPLVEILHYQTALESLSLFFRRTTCGKLGHRLISSLSQLFTYPKFKVMKLQYLIDFPIAGIISSFLCSPTNHLQRLELVHQRVAAPCDNSDLNFELPSEDHAHLYGLNKELMFKSVTASRAFYDWLFNMPCIRLNSLSFHRCRMLADGGRKVKPQTMLGIHPDACVSHFSCENFRLVQW